MSCNSKLSCRYIYEYYNYSSNKFTNFNARFKDFLEKNLGWIKIPFNFNINEIKLGNLKISEELIDLLSDKNLRIRF
jgi:hypothetical protein